MYNVQIALSALENITAIAHAVSDVKPADIVDGHREKTVTLLWTLISQYGLSHMVQMQDLKSEIRRVTCHNSNLNQELEVLSEPDQINTERLLKLWARACAAKNNVQVTNLSTSFADGRAFEAILNEYEPFLVQSLPGTLSQRLQYLGCSKQFSNIFHFDSQVQIFSKDFVMAALAFLFSRVVVPSRQCRSAVTIQRCWRKYWKRVDMDRKATKRILAHACVATLVRKSNEPSESVQPAPSQSQLDTGFDEDIWLAV